MSGFDIYQFAPLGRVPQRKIIPVSCERCRKRKIKCNGFEDGKGSCLNCQNEGSSSSCYFLRVNATIATMGPRNLPFPQSRNSYTPAHHHAPPPEAISALPAAYFFDTTAQPVQNSGIHYIRELLPCDELKGLDIIIYNTYCYPDDSKSSSGTLQQFKTFRYFSNATIDKFLIMIASHVGRDLYKIININASQGGCYLMVACEKHWDELGEGRIFWEAG